MLIVWQRHTRFFYLCPYGEINVSTFDTSLRGVLISVFLFAFKFHHFYSLAYYPDVATSQSFFRVGYNTRTSFVQPYRVLWFNSVLATQLGFHPLECTQSLRGKNIQPILLFFVCSLLSGKDTNIPYSAPLYQVQTWLLPWFHNHFGQMLKL